MKHSIFILICLFAGTSFCAPFFTRDLTLSTARVTIRIDSTQATFNKVDSLCTGKPYYYFSINKKGGCDIHPNVQVIKHMTDTSYTVTISTSGTYSTPTDTLSCSTLAMNNLVLKNQKLTTDTTTIRWDYLLLVKERHASSSNLIKLNGDLHIRITLRKGTDSTSIYMTKEQIKQTSIMPSENDNTCNEIKPITYATLQELQNSGACVMLFNATGRKVGNILNRQLTFFNTLRPTAGVLLYTMTNKDGHIQTGKVIIR